MLARIIFCIAMLFPLISQADEFTPQKSNDIKKLMVVTGGSRIGLQMGGVMMQNLAPILKKAYPNLPDRTFAVLNQEMLSLFEEKMNASGGLMDLLTPIYAKHFTHAEIKELLAFYQTDIGRKVINVMPLALSESMAVGQKWGESLAPEINQRVTATLQKEGLTPPRK